VTQILSDGSDNLPQYETERPTTVKFSPKTKKPDNTPVILDTFGKPRAIESGEPHYATVTLGGARSKDFPGHRGGKYAMQPHLDLDHHGSGHLSPASSSTDHSSDSGRLVDEAYGTLGRYLEILGYFLAWKFPGF